MAPPSTDPNDPTPDSSAGPAKASEEELRASQSRLLKLLIEAQDRLRKERSSNGNHSGDSSKPGGLDAAK